MAHFSPLPELEQKLDLNALIIQRPAATFFFREKNTGDILVVDRSITPSSGKTVIAIVDGEFVLRKIKAKEKVEVWGVVTYVIHSAG